MNDVIRETVLNFAYTGPYYVVPTRELTEMLEKQRSLSASSEKSEGSRHRTSRRVSAFLFQHSRIDYNR